MDAEKRKDLQAVLRELFDTFNIQSGFLMFVEHGQINPYVLELHCNEKNELINTIVDGIAMGLQKSGVRIQVNPKGR
jgi:hypothetical protein